jgi:hypothetical protein
VPTPDLFPIRAYLRNDREREIVAAVFKEGQAGDAQFYASSAEGSVTEAGLRRLLAQHVIIDSLASAAPALAANDIQPNVPAAQVPPPDSDDEAIEAAVDCGFASMEDEDSDADSGPRPSLLSGVEDVARNLLDKSPILSHIVGAAKGRLDSLSDELPVVLRRPCNTSPQKASRKRFIVN